MNETVLSALIGACGAVIVCLITQFFILKKARLEMIESSNRQREEMYQAQKESIVGLQHQIEMIVYKIDELTKHVEKHNQVIDRTYTLEKRCDVLEEQMKVANHHIDDLEHNI